MSAHASSIEGVFPRPSASAEPVSHTSDPDPAPSSDSISDPASISEPPLASAPSPRRPEAPLPPSFTASLLAGEGEDGPLNLVRDATRFGIGIGLSSLYGVALGARHGGRALFTQAAVVPSALLAIAALGIPALYIGLALFDAPLAPSRLVSATARSAARTGIVLAGLAPAAALFVVTTSDSTGAAVAAAIGLFIAGVLGLHGLVAELFLALDKAPATTRAASRLALLGFGAFAVVLTLRLWLPAVMHVGGAK